MSEAMTEVALQMVKLVLDGRRLEGLAHARGLRGSRSGGGTDGGYVVHCALGELFGEHAPEVFSIERASPLGVEVLAYAEVGRQTLQEMASAFAAPEIYELCRWEAAASKPMPTRFPEGMRLGYEVRACPVVRLSGQGPGGRKKKGAEVDAYLAACWRAEDDTAVDREEVYRGWFAGQLERRKGAHALGVKMKNFQLARMMRRTQRPDRKAHTIKRPSVILMGQLEVTNSEAFSELLARGIGRHKSFGFGMIKIHRARG